MRQKVVSIAGREASLKRRVRQHLKQLGFQKAADGTLTPPSLDKDTYRAIHSHQRLEKLKAHEEWIERAWPTLERYFASGDEVEVGRISPRLELAPKDTWQADLFRLAGLYWRIPISEGYGRRIRFLVWDDHNDKLIGLLALGDAVFNLRVRDALIGWDHNRRAEALVNLMDAYVLGALPPYSSLLGGKLIASLIRTREVVDVFDNRYRASIGVISKKVKKARLVAVTTTSALGRSSIYNRVKLGGNLLLRPIGFTSGWGHFHISDSVFEQLRDYLRYVGDPYADSFKYGSGPNWRIRAIRRALDLLGLDPNLIRHGFSREVFFCPIAENALPFLRGDHVRVRYGELPTIAQVSALALERWSIPRSERNPEYRQWRAEDLLAGLQSRNEVGVGQQLEAIRRGLGN